MTGDFYFIKDEFYSAFQNYGVLPNKEPGNNTGNRPCFFAFQDIAEKEIFWFVPISSKAEKYNAIYQKNIGKYGKCDFLEFGVVLGTDAAFLIQNMFPVTKNFVEKRYDVNGTAVRTDNITTAKVIKKAQTVLEKSKKGIKLTFTNIGYIYSHLLVELAEERAKNNKVEITPLQIYNRTEKELMVKLPGATPEEPKQQILLPKDEVMLKDDKVVAVSERLQVQHKFPQPAQPKRFLKT